MAGKTEKIHRHPAWQRYTMPADVRALGSYANFIRDAIRINDSKRKGGGK